MINMKSSGTFANGFGFGETVSRDSGEVRIPGNILTKLNSIGILTVEDLLREANINTVKVAAALGWPTSYVRDAMIILLPKLNGFDIPEDLLKIPGPVKQG